MLTVWEKSNYNYLSLTTWLNETQDFAKQEIPARGKLESQESVCVEDVRNLSHGWSNSKEATVYIKHCSYQELPGR